MLEPVKYDFSKRDSSEGSLVTNQQPQKPKAAPGPLQGPEYDFSERLSVNSEPEPKLLVQNTSTKHYVLNISQDDPLPEKITVKRGDMVVSELQLECRTFGVSSVGAKKTSEGLEPVDYGFKNLGE